MLFKITLSITVFVVVCFRNSQGFNTVKCTNDDEFLKAAKDYKYKIVPILVSWGVHDDNIVQILARSGLNDVIVVYADKNRCPITNGYLRTNGIHPAVYVMINDRLHVSVWHYGMKLREFYEDAVKNRNLRLPNEAVVTDTIEREIQKKNNEREIGQAGAAAWRRAAPTTERSDEARRGGQSTTAVPKPVAVAAAVAVGAVGVAAGMETYMKNGGSVDGARKRLVRLAGPAGVGEDRRISRAANYYAPWQNSDVAGMRRRPNQQGTQSSSSSYYYDREPSSTRMRLS